MQQYRKTIRLQGYDYSQQGEYFITICTNNVFPYFGEVDKESIHLNQVGKIVEKCWLEIPLHHKDVVVDHFVIMPNHLHGIVELRYPDKTTNDSDVLVERPYNISGSYSKLSPKKKSLSVIVRSFKAVSTSMIKQAGQPTFAWQPRFYDHIIRTEKAYQEIVEYIDNNPLKWQFDKENPQQLWM